jgi:membrane-bound ClpP family serine protease
MLLLPGFSRLSANEPIKTEELIKIDDQVQPNDAVNGFVMDVPIPLTPETATAVVDQLVKAGNRADGDRRVTVVMRYVLDSDIAASNQQDLGGETEFEDAFRLARAMTGDQLRKVRLVSWVDRPVSGHSVLPIIASDLLLVGPAGVIQGADSGEAAFDDTLELNYLAIAKRRGLFPPAIVSAMVDQRLELAAITKVGGQKSYAAGDELAKLRKEGKLLGEESWSPAGQPLRITADRLRDSRIASSKVSSMAEVAQRLDLAEILPLGQGRSGSVTQAVLLEITGSIAPTRTRRWQSNLDSTLSSDDVDAWVISIDSIGGSLGSSASLATWFADPPPPVHTIAGYVRGEARGDAVLIAMACKPLMMNPESRIGGQGAATILDEDMKQYDEMITEIAKTTNRPAALIRGLLNPELDVYRYTNRKTGRLRYASPDDLQAEWDGSDDPEQESRKWERGAQIDLSNGLTAAEAISMGLADQQVDSLDAAARQIGLKGTPAPVAERTLVRFVERLGRSTGLSFLLLFIGFAALSTEANAPGLSFPGFVAMICFALFFWMKFLNGTAEWLELLALSLGLICIAIELFVVPGFGVFGVGGLALTVLGIVLMSQTFVIPQNVYQIGLFTRGVWGALAGAAGMIGGFVVMRWFFPYVPFFSGLIMEAPDSVRLEQSEMLGDYSQLMGQSGVATTPLRPSGKARFGDQVVQVISDGSMIATGMPIRVCEVHATKVIVELDESQQVSQQVSQQGLQQGLQPKPS